MSGPIRKSAVDHLPADAEFLLSVLESSADCIKILDLDGNLLFMSEDGQRIMEVSDFNTIRGCPWPEFWEGELNLTARGAVETAKNGGIGRFHGPATTMAGSARHARRPASGLATTEAEIADRRCP